MFQFTDSSAVVGGGILCDFNNRSMFALRYMDGD
jgi:hypothetical protein